MKSDVKVLTEAKGIVWPGTFSHSVDHSPNFNKHEIPPGKEDILRYPTEEEIEKAICKMEETHGAHRPVAMTFGSFGGELCCLPLFSDDDDLMTKEDQKNFYQELKESVKEDTTCAGAYCLCEPIEEGVAAWPSGDSEQEPEQAKTL